MDINKCFELLEIKPTDDTEIIKKAFKKKALKYHPDKNKILNTEEKFKEINEAYQILLKYIQENNIVNINKNIIRRTYNYNISHNIQGINGIRINVQKQNGVKIHTTLTTCISKKHIINLQKKMNSQNN